MPIDFSAERWERIQENARLWWKGELRRPLIQIAVNGCDPGRPRPRLPFKHFTAHYGLSEPVEDIVDAWDYHLSTLRFLGDAFPTIWPNFGPGIAAGFLGANVHADARTVWFGPKETVAPSELRFTYSPDNVWLCRVKDLCRVALERWEGRVLLGTTDLGGTLDILASFLKTEPLLTYLLTEPDEIKRLTWEIHELWFRYFGEFEAILQPVNPGYTSWAGIYSKESTYMLQCDICFNIGPRHFDEFVKPELSAACARLEHAFYHLDGPGQLAHLDSLLSIEELDGVQWVPGAGSPLADAWPEVYRKIHDAGKKIQVVGGRALEAVDLIARELGTAEDVVLCATVPAREERSAFEFLKKHGAL